MFRRLLGLVDTATAPARRLAGTDLAGNKYFEVLPVEGSQTRYRTRRVMEPAGGEQHAAYSDSNIVAPWRAWLAGTRADAPSIDELEELNRQQEQLQENVQALSAKERERRVRELGEEAVRQAEADEARRQHLGLVDHAAAFTPGGRDTVLSPLRRGDEFQPAHWLPAGTQKTEEKETEAGGRGKEETKTTKEWAPEEWDPTGGNKS
eukprot:comp18337_c0_seq1/m.19434 comp18337_c0_seq1/g.19434  ORF comp18337_c0_seq1/g.19434 comp18337_c0_seq1/m.19434 type:complete len:207 (-) comp18337_c0_seq1:197-817(-)